MLSLDLDSKGGVAHAKAISGPKDLAAAAIADAKMFRYPEQANASGITQHILFRRGADEVRMVTPDYLPMAKAKAAGLVELVATVGPDGHVVDVTVARGHPLLRNQAENALRQWVFAPVLKDGAPVQCHAIVRFNFDSNRFPN
ncbi:MAG TPA: energy transducer TonB [Acidobacteriaceae bacterium]|nr:energy transducer TonB [Acidobacteriaceae bacterium]